MTAHGVEHELSGPKFWSNAEHEPWIAAQSPADGEPVITICWSGHTDPVQFFDFFKDTVRVAQVIDTPLDDLNTFVVEGLYEEAVSGLRPSLNFFDHPEFVRYEGRTPNDQLIGAWARLKLNDEIRVDAIGFHLPKASLSGFKKELIDYIVTTASAHAQREQVEEAISEIENGLLSVG